MIPADFLHGRTVPGSDLMILLQGFIKFSVSGLCGQLLLSQGAFF